MSRVETLILKNVPIGSFGVFFLVWWLLCYVSNDYSEVLLPNGKSLGLHLSAVMYYVLYCKERILKTLSSARGCLVLL